MRRLRFAFLALTGLLALTACSNMFGAAPSGPDGQYMGSSQQYQDYSQHMQQSPDVAASHDHSE